ncbi:MAG: tungsten cofactor oxidoreductase radical SAM maturase [Ardenticatenia bacterium]|nr:MAG: tungsten cofactor oxidoreductase radical SAM maturase [Ardenticatenia bacterium]
MSHLATIEQDGTIRLPESFLQHSRSVRGTQYWIEQRDSRLVLLPRLPDLQKVYVEPTTACNLYCRTCIRNVWQDPEAHMEMALFEQLVEQLGAFPEIRRVVFSGLGEPMSHPHFVDMVRLVRARGIAVTVGSNGVLMDRALAREQVLLGVDRLVLSLDGVRPETYAGVRGTTIAVVLDNIRGLNEVKRELRSLTPALGIEFVALRSNVAELAELSSLASRLGAARVLVSNVLAYTEDMYQEILYGYGPRAGFAASGWPVKADAWVLWGTVDLPRMHWGAEQRCRFVHDRATVVGWDGSVSPCYAFSHNYSYLTIDGRRKRVTRYSMGNITQQPLVEIWTSATYCRFRDEVRDFRFPSCPDCDLRDSCSLREQNQACWGWDPSCADCLWAQDIIRCP